MFTDLLRDITTRIDDIDGVLLMGIDGLPIDKSIKNETINIESVTAEFTSVLRNTHATAVEIGAGKLDELVIISDKLMLLFKVITPEYFLMMILPQGANFGRARFEMKKAKYSLEKELI